MKCKKGKTYYKFYGPNGEECYIKISKHLKLDKPTKVCIRWTEQGSGEHKYHIPQNEFSSVEEVISHIVCNLEPSSAPKVCQSPRLIVWACW